MVFGRVVCRGARSRESRYHGQPALLVSRGQAVDMSLHDGRVEIRGFWRDKLSGDVQLGGAGNTDGDQHVESEDTSTPIQIKGNLLSKRPMKSTLASS